MPPKSKIKKKVEEKSLTGPATSEPTEKETLLKAELKAATNELVETKERVEELKRDNDWLLNEAQRIRVETHEYMNYMEKKTSKRQTTIVTLSDHNKQEIQNIDEQKKMISKEYDEKKERLKVIMLEKQHMLDKAKKELENMHELKMLQQSQTSRIKELENLITEKRAEYSLKVTELKQRFLEDKHSFQEESDQSIQTLKNEANRKAFRCLTEHTNSIRIDNRALREKLLNLIKETKELQVHKDNLEGQRKQILREQQYAEDMRALRLSTLVKCGVVNES